MLRPQFRKTFTNENQNICNKLYFASVQKLHSSVSFKQRLKRKEFVAVTLWESLVVGLTNTYAISAYHH